VALDAEAVHFHALKVEAPATESVKDAACAVVAEDQAVQQRRRSSKVYLAVPAEREV
jgi:hypothetical protein